MGWLFKNAYDKALAQYKKLRNLQQGSQEYNKTVFEVARLARNATKTYVNTSDAHILLANAYYLIALMDFPDNFVEFFPLALTTINWWHLAFSNTSKNKDLGMNLFYEITSWLREEKIPDWLKAELPKYDWLDKQLYERATGIRTRH